MPTIEAWKESGLVQINVVPKPLVLCQITAVDGDTVYLTTTPELGGATRVYNGNTYQARLQSNPISQIQAQSPEGYDIPGSINLAIADGDNAIWSSHANAHGWRGGTLTVTFVLWDAPSDTYSSNSYVWTFILDKPNLDGPVVTVAGQARQSMTRLNVPNTPRQNRCSHSFPMTAAQRLDGLLNPTSPYYACGYCPNPSADSGGAYIGPGAGNQATANLTNPNGSALTDASGNFVMCDFTRSCGSRSSTSTQGCIPRMGNYAGNPAGATASAADGDITRDTSGRATARFDGDTYLAPPGYSGRQFVNPSAGKIYGFNVPNPPTGQTYYNQGYGVQWVDATVLEPVSDVNSYRAECIVCIAPIGPVTIIKVLVNGVEVTLNNSDALFTYYIISAGGRNGAVSLDSSYYQGTGDPHGSLCCIEIVVPFELQASGSIASVQVLVQFPQCLHAMPISTSASSGGSSATIDFPGGIPNNDCAGNPPFSVYVTGNSFIPDGAYELSGRTSSSITLVGSFATGSGAGGSCFYYPLNGADAAMVDAAGAAAANPVWALMDLMTWGPFTVADFDTLTWYNAAQICAAQINYVDINNNPASHARYRCSFVLTTDKRQSMAKAVLGLRNCAGIILARNPINGLIQCFIEQTLADQQPAAIPGSNYNTPVASITAAGITSGIVGYLAYLFDGAGSIETGTFKLGGRSLNDTPNTVAFPFQDSANVWVQDSCTTIDPNGYVTSGNQEIEAALQILGVENFDQATRMSNLGLAKSLYGNSRFDAGGTELPTFRTTVKAAHLASRVGFICGIIYAQRNL